jgi:hypothetical protein
MCQSENKPFWCVLSILAIDPRVQLQVAGRFNRSTLVHMPATFFKGLVCECPHLKTPTAGGSMPPCAAGIPQPASRFNTGPVAGGPYPAGAV